MGRAYSPNPNKPPFYADLPYEFDGEQMHVNEDVLAIWQKESPVNMVDSYTNNLRKLNAIKFDWGRNEENLHIPITCKLFSQKLETHGIKHYAEEYLGTHTNLLWTDDGRAMTATKPTGAPFYNESMGGCETAFTLWRCAP